MPEAPKCDSVAGEQAAGSHRLRVLALAAGRAGGAVAVSEATERLSQRGAQIVVAAVNGELERICHLFDRMLRVIEESFDARVMRVGKDGSDFELLKLRTMVVGAEQQGAGFAVDASCREHGARRRGRRLGLSNRRDVGEDRDRQVARRRRTRRLDECRRGCSRRQCRDLVVRRLDDQLARRPVGGHGETVERRTEGVSEPEDQGNPESSRDDRGMAVRRSTGKGDPAHELGAKDGNDRRVEIVRGEDRGRPIAVVELGPGSAVDPKRRQALIERYIKPLRTGKIALLVENGSPIVYWYDPTRPDSRLARFEVDKAVPGDLKQAAAVMAVTAWELANLPELLPRGAKSPVVPVPSKPSPGLAAR